MVVDNGRSRTYQYVCPIIKTLLVGYQTIRDVVLTVQKSCSLKYKKQLAIEVILF